MLNTAHIIVCELINDTEKKKKISKSMQCRKQYSSTELYIVKCVLLQKLRKIITRAENN